MEIGTSMQSISNNLEQTLTLF